MKQVLALGAFDNSYAATTQYLPVLGTANTAGSWSYSDTFGGDSAKIPCAAPGTFKNFSILAYGVHPDTTVTLLKNGVATGITAAITSGQTVAMDAVHTVSVVAGDDVSLKLVGGSSQGAGSSLSFSLEFDASVANTSIYGISAGAGSVVAGHGFIGGACGNGIFQPYDSGAPLTLSNTYSISSLTGAVTRLDLHNYGGAVGTSVWTGYLKKNGVLQDGSGGTVNTACILNTGNDPAAFSTFSLPVVPTDHLDVVVVVTVTNAGFADAQVAAGIAVVSTDGTFMLCGGNNDAFLNSTPNWKWNGTQQEGTPEAAQQVPTFPGFAMQGLYIELGNQPGAGTSWVDTIRQNGSNTGLTLTFTGATQVLSILAPIVFGPNDLVDLLLSPVNTPTSGEVHWGLNAIAALPVPPPVPLPPPGQTATAYPIRRLRQAVHLSQEQLWSFYTRLQVDMETGVGLNTGQGNAPVMMVSWSDDGGHVWSDELFVPFGPIGAFRWRAILWRMGRGRDRVYRVVVSDPVKMAIVDGLLDVTPGTS